MIANYHTHTHRCGHAGGYQDREYVEAALKAGMEVLGFADHAPQIFPGDYYSPFRMRPEMLADYVRSISGLKEEYRGRIELLIGLETEYYPRHFGDLVAFLREYPMDYLILGQHFVGNEYDVPGRNLYPCDRSTLERYCSQSMEAMNTGLFTYFAHPDQVQYVDDPKVFQKAVRSMCREAQSLGIPLELNLEGVRRNKHYPLHQCYFWEVAAEEGCDVILGCDAHSPGHLDCSHDEQKARDMARDLGLKVLDRVELRPIHK